MVLHKIMKISFNVLKKLDIIFILLRKSSAIVVATLSSINLNNSASLLLIVRLYGKFLSKFLNSLIATLALVTLYNILLVFI